MKTGKEKLSLGEAYDKAHKDAEETIELLTSLIGELQEGSKSQLAALKKAKAGSLHGADANAGGPSKGSSKGSAAKKAKVSNLHKKDASAGAGSPKGKKSKEPSKAEPVKGKEKAPAKKKGIKATADTKKKKKTGTGHNPFKRQTHNGPAVGPIVGPREVDQQKDWDCSKSGSYKQNCVNRTTGEKKVIRIKPGYKKMYNRVYRKWQASGDK